MMFMFHGLVRVPVLMVLADVHPNTKSHQTEKEASQQHRLDVAHQELCQWRASAEQQSGQ